MRYGRTIGVLALTWAALWCAGSCSAANWKWLYTHSGSQLEIYYGGGTDYPQFGVLHVDSSYLRLVPTRDSEWGTSVVLMPSYWHGGQYYQGVHVAVLSVHVVNGRLAIKLSAALRRLRVAEIVTILPPAGGSIQATVAATTTGQLTIDPRPYEAFKPVLLSSMRSSNTCWDARAVILDGVSYPVPKQGWIFYPPKPAQTFGIKGGTSQCKVNAPTVLIGWGGTVPVTGWVTLFDPPDPTQDNVPLWPAFDKVISSWTYTITSKRP